MPTVDDMKAQADKIGLKYPSKIKKADLAALLDAAMSKTTVTDVRPTMPEDVEFPTVESQHRMVERIHTHTNAPVSKPIGQRVMVRMIRAAQSRRYGQNGRGMGAKHYPMRDVFYTVNPDAIKPLSYADRVRHYAVQNGQGLLTANEFPGAMLTPRQWRRAQHKQNANRAFGTKEARYL